MGQQWEKISLVVGRRAPDCRDRYRNHVVGRETRVVGELLGYFYVSRFSSSHFYRTLDNRGRGATATHRRRYDGQEQDGLPALSAPRSSMIREINHRRPVNLPNAAIRTGLTAPPDSRQPIAANRIHRAPTFFIEAAMASTMRAAGALLSGRSRAFS